MEMFVPDTESTTNYISSCPKIITLTINDCSFCFHDGQKNEYLPRDVNGLLYVDVEIGFSVAYHHAF